MIKQCPRCKTWNDTENANCRKSLCGSRLKPISEERALQIINNVAEEFVDLGDTSFATKEELCETILWLRETTVDKDWYEVQEENGRKQDALIQSAQAMIELNMYKEFLRDNFSSLLIMGDIAYDIETQDITREACALFAAELRHRLRDFTDGIRNLEKES